MGFGYLFPALRVRGHVFSGCQTLSICISIMNIQDIQLDLVLLYAEDPLHVRFTHGVFP